MRQAQRWRYRLQAPQITASIACRKGAGNVFWRRAQRRRIPARAFALKQYFGGIEPRSSTCDNKHTLASLGRAEILGIEHPPREQVV